MKICAVLTKAEMEADVVQVIEGLANRGHQVHTILHTGETSWNPKIDNLKIYPTNDFLFLDRISPINVISLRATKIIKKNNIDAVYATPGCLGEGLIASWLTGKPVLCDVRNPWSIQMFDHTRGVSIKRKIGIFLLSIKYFFEELLIKRANIVTAYSKGIKDWLLDYIGISSNKIKIIGPHVDLKKFNIDKNKKSKLREVYEIGESKLIMYVGALQFARGLDIMLYALKIINDKGYSAKFMFIGPLKYNERFYEQTLSIIDKLNLNDKVIFTDYLPFDLVPEYISVADIMVMPHRDCLTYQISPPVKLLEYMACKKPIVSTRVGVDEYIKDGYNALVVDNADPFEIAEATIRIIKNEKLSLSLARNARNKVEKSYNIDTMLDKFEKSFTTLIKPIQ